MQKPKFLWIAVTTDKYEFPIYIEDTAKELGKRLGITASTVIGSVQLNKSGTTKGRKIMKVEVNDEYDIAN